MKVFFLILLALVLLCVTPVLVMWLWNWVAVDLFNAPVIDFWQACGLYWLSAIFFNHSVRIKSE